MYILKLIIFYSNSASASGSQFSGIYPRSIPKVIHRSCGKQRAVRWLLVAMIGFASACANQPPRKLDNLCEIFTEKRSWYKAAKRAEKKWGAPLQVPMAMMYQESRFVDNARPPRNYLLGFIPWGRKSSAYGYSQAKTSTWKDYKRETGNGWADRDDFDDAIDFMGWFIYKTHKVNKISKWDAKTQYLNYHEGWGGYRRGSYRQKQWLVKVADRVGSQASRYGAQYRGCKKELNKSWFRRLFS